MVHDKARKNFIALQLFSRTIICWVVGGTCRRTFSCYGFPGRYYARKITKRVTYIYIYSLF